MPVRSKLFADGKCFAMASRQLNVETPPRIERLSGLEPHFLNTCIISCVWTLFTCFSVISNAERFS